MKLLYLYIGHMNRLLDYHEISFSNSFDVSFARNTKTLIIRKNEQKKQSIYGENILDLKLLAGKNGCGKTTILNLLGLPSQELKKEFEQHSDRRQPCSKNAYDWFALYHLEDDHFALEGYNPHVVLELSITNPYYLQNYYSVHFVYDFEHHTLSSVEVLQDAKDKNTESRYSDLMSYLFYYLEPDISWYSRPKRRKNNSYENFFFQRYDISKFSFYAVEYFLYRVAKGEFNTLFDSNPTSLKIEVEIGQHNILNLELENKMEQLIYGEGGSFISLADSVTDEMFKNSHKLTHKHTMIIRYLEELLVYLLNESPVDNPEKFQDEESTDETFDEEKKYRSRKEFLLRFMEYLTKTPAAEAVYKDVVMYPNDLQLAQQFCEALEQIPDEFITEWERAEILLSECESNFLEPLMQAYDTNQEQEHEVNHGAFVSFHVMNLSTGEAALLDLYAALLGGIREMDDRTKSVIILLDEPDSRLHPEWSRLFLKRLVVLLSTKSFREYQFQIIITTHSPLLLSDVPQQDIICLKQTEDGIHIEHPKFGFMGNLNDILLDSMFLSSPFGAFAEEYTNKIIKKIDDLKKNLQETDQTNNLQAKSNVEEQIGLLQEQIELINEPYIKKFLNQSINKLRIRLESQMSNGELIAYHEKELERLHNLEKQRTILKGEKL